MIREAFIHSDSRSQEIYLTETDSRIAAQLKGIPFKTPQILDPVFLKPEILRLRNRSLRHRTSTKNHYGLLHRRMTILLYGLSGKRISVQDLTEEFNVSNRTILRDLQYLNANQNDFEYDRDRKCYRLIYSPYQSLIKS